VLNGFQHPTLDVVVSQFAMRPALQKLAAFLQPSLYLESDVSDYESILLAMAS